MRISDWSSDVCSSDLVVFMPHAFMSLNVPEALKHVRAVIADERIHHLFLHTTTFSATTLMIPRRKPRLSRREIARDVKPEDLLTERLPDTEVQLRDLRRRRRPARALTAPHEHKHDKV